MLATGLALPTAPLFTSQHMEARVQQLIVSVGSILELKRLLTKSKTGRDAEWKQKRLLKNPVRNSHGNAFSNVFIFRLPSVQFSVDSNYSTQRQLVQDNYVQYSRARIRKKSTSTDSSQKKRMHSPCYDMRKDGRGCNWRDLWRPGMCKGSGTDKCWHHRS